MVGDKKESWVELCELPAQEKDPTRLTELIAELTDFWKRSTSAWRRFPIP